MIIDNKLFNALLSQAEKSARLRMNYDLRTSGEDSSQRMLNALLPGTEVAIHRHRETTETVFILKGKIEEIFYDDNGNEYQRYLLDTDSDNKGCVIPKGAWHTIIVHEPSIIFEAKDGDFQPLNDDDILNIF